MPEDTDGGASVGRRAFPDDGPATDHLDVSAVLARLDPDDRALIAMRYLAGLDSDEIARATGRSASGVRARLSRLMSRIREELSDV